MADDIFTILYEVNGQKYVIGVTNDNEPRIATLGVNTPRPLPMNMRDALKKMVREVREMDHDPELIDYNSPASRMSQTMFTDLQMTPLQQTNVHQSVAEALEELEKRMRE